VLRNAGGTTCTLYGYPGVSFVSGPSGQQVGAPAEKAPGSVAPVTLNPGQSATANLGIAQAANFSSGCQITAVAGLRVYPPNQTASLFIAHSDEACANTADVTLRVGPFSAG
jgi:hypothetical protein